MKLPILNQPKYLSPSSFEEFNDCNMRFYLKRMAGLEWPRGVQSMPAAVGSAFDAFIKNEVAKRMGLGNDPQYSLDSLIESSVEEHNRANAVVLGRTIFQDYLRAGMLDLLMDEGLSSIEMTDQKNIESNECSVPILGKPDAALGDGTLVDWKVQGAASASGASPTPGYCRGIRGYQTLGAHARAGEPLEAINPRWARQLSVYTWLFTGLLPFRNIRVAIENIAVRNGKYTFTSIRTIITKEFQMALYDGYVEAWERITSGKIDDANPSNTRCFPYNSMCEVADRCEAFQKWQNAPKDTISMLMGQ